jgi:2,3-dihydroxybenzoate-AMP ligase
LGPDYLFGDENTLAAHYQRGSVRIFKTAIAMRAVLVSERGVAKFKLPEHLELVDQLRQTHVRKSNKKGLRRIIADRLKEEG